MIQPYQTVKNHAVLLLDDNIDTDQIYPGRFLTATTRDGMGDKLFIDRKQEADFPLNGPDATNAQILIGGENFGTGSSREHAVWAMMAGGFRIVIARSFADIFQNNAGKNGLLAVPLADDAYETITSYVQTNPNHQLIVSLREETIHCVGQGVVAFHIDPFTRRCLLEGLDQLTYLLSQQPAIETYETNRGAA